MNLLFCGNLATPPLKHAPLSLQCSRHGAADDSAGVTELDDVDVGVNVYVNAPVDCCLGAVHIARSMLGHYQ